MEVQNNQKGVPGQAQEMDAPQTGETRQESAVSSSAGEQVLGQTISGLDVEQVLNSRVGSANTAAISPEFAQDKGKKSERTTGKTASAVREEENGRVNRHGFQVLYRKELADHLESKRFWILFFLLLIISMVSLRGALNTISTTVSQASSQGATVTDFLFLALFTTSGSSIYSFSTFLGFLGPIFGIMMGFDAINEEQSQGTLNRLAAQPIYRDTIINAKFAAAATTVFITIFAVGFLFTGAGIVISGIDPLPEEFARIAIFLLVASIYVCVWLSISILFSVLSKHAATSALGCIALWLVLTLFMSLIASGIANALINTNSPTATVMDVINNYRLQTGISRISPYYLFSEVTSVLMNPNVHSLDIMSSLEAQYTQVASYLSLGQSVLQIWPQIVAMFAETVVGFAIAYICFMNREIRA